MQAERVKSLTEHGTEMPLVLCVVYPWLLEITSWAFWCRIYNISQLFIGKLHGFIKQILREPHQWKTLNPWLQSSKLTSQRLKDFKDKNMTQFYLVIFFSYFFSFLLFRNNFQGHILFSSLGKNVIIKFYFSKMSWSIP